VLVVLNNESGSLNPPLGYKYASCCHLWTSRALEAGNVEVWMKLSPRSKFIGVMPELLKTISDKAAVHPGELQVITTSDLLALTSNQHNSVLGKVR